MAERIIQSLKDRLSHVNIDQGVDLGRNLNVAVSAYCMVPHRATVSCCLCCSMAVKQFRHMKSHSLGMILKNSTKTLLVLILKMFELHKRVFFRNRKYQLKMKETFNRRKVHKEIIEFQIGGLVWLNILRQIPDMKFNKAKWVGPCKISSI